MSVHGAVQFGRARVAGGFIISRSGTYTVIEDKSLLVM